MVKCDTCPRFKDVYPDRRDPDGYPFGICGLTGNKVYRIPHKIKRLSGKGYIHFGIGSCGLYDSIEDALADMTEAEVRRWEVDTVGRRRLLRMFSLWGALDVS